MSTVIRLLNPILMIVFGLGLGAILAKRLKLDWGLFGAGALTFIGSQVLHIPFNAWLLTPSLKSFGLLENPSGIKLVLVALALGASAGVFEEGARYCVYRFWLKDVRNWEKSLMFGAGHGGAEAVILGILTLVTVFRLIALQDADLSTVIPLEHIELAEAQIAAFWEQSWPIVLLGALERAIVLVIHLAMTLLVLQAFVRKNILWLGLAILWHTLVDAAAVFSVQTWGAYAAEGVIILFSLASLGIVIALRPRRESTPPPHTLEPPPQIEIMPPTITAKEIEETQYE